MFYEFPLEIAANTLQTSPEEQEIKLTHGIIDYIEVEFPSGCSGLVHVVIKRFQTQVFPTGIGQSFCSDNHVIPVKTYFELLVSPFTLLLEGWSDDDTFAHTPRIRIGVLPLDVAVHIYGRRSKRAREELIRAFGLGEV